MMASEEILLLGGLLTLVGGKIERIDLTLGGKDGSYSISGPAVFTPVGQIEPVPLEPEIIPYSMRDPRWINKVYAGGETFGRSGCYTTAVAIINSLTGSLDEPPIIAEAMRRAGCYEGAFLSHPERIPDACPGLRYDGPMDVSKDGPLRWHYTAADMERVWAELALGPLIMEVDFRPTTRKVNQHFVVGLEWDKQANDITIIDTWDGQRVGLMERYALVWYALGKDELESAICGLRLLRVA